jgi:hypothetical protein
VGDIFHLSLLAFKLNMSNSIEIAESAKQLFCLLLVIHTKQLELLLMFSDHLKVLAPGQV